MGQLVRKVKINTIDGKSAEHRLSDAEAKGYIRELTEGMPPAFRFQGDEGDNGRVSFVFTHAIASMEFGAPFEEKD